MSVCWPNPPDADVSYSTFFYIPRFSTGLVPGIRPAWLEVRIAALMFLLCLHKNIFVIAFHLVSHWLSYFIDCCVLSLNSVANGYDQHRKNWWTGKFTKALVFILFYLNFIKAWGGYLVYTCTWRYSTYSYASKHREKINESYFHTQKMVLEFSTSERHKIYLNQHVHSIKNWFSFWINHNGLC